MLTLDINTIRFSATLVVLATLISLIAYWNSRHPDKSTHWWIVGILSFSLAYLGILYNQGDASPISIVLEQSGLGVCGLLFLNAVRIKIGKIPLRKATWLLLALLPVLSVFALFTSRIHALNEAIFLLNAVCGLLSAWEMWRHARAKSGNLYVSCAVLFLLNGLFNLGICLYYFFSHNFGTNVMWALMMGTSIGLSLLNHTFMLLAYDDLQQELDWALHQLRTESANKLKSIEQRWLLALDYAKSGAWEVDLVTREAVMSVHWARLLGLADQELRLPSVKAITYMHPDDVQSFRDLINKLETGEIEFMEHEHRVQCSNGNWIWVCTRARKMSFSDRSHDKVVGIDIDITESRLRQTQLEAAIATAEQAKEIAIQASKAKTTFLTNISHEIRTPMNAILGFSQLLMDDKHLTEKHKESLEIISSSGVHLMELIDDILNLSRIQSGNFTARLEPVKVRELFDEIAHYFHKRNARSSIRFEVRLSPALPSMLMLDSKALRQVCMNLLSNAFKFTRSGVITLDLDYQPGKETRHGLLVLAVTDTGIGIREEHLHLIFNRFEQGDAPYFSDEGIGLGLALCKDIVNQLEGRIDVQSKAGEGSRFTVLLPVEIAEAEVVDTESIAQVVTEQQPSILVVDDIESNRLLLKRILDGRGYAIREASSAAEALTMMREQCPALVLMDIRMPVLGGDQAIEHMRKDPALASIPVIAITANVAEGEKERLLEIGANDFINKPFMRDEILGKVSMHLSLTSVAPAVQENVPEPKEVTKPVAPKLKMLVVDDNPANQQLLLAQLRTLGLQADAARNGREAINSWYLHQHNIVLTDCAMPLLDGFELCRMIRKAESESGTAKPTLVIAVTGSPEEYSERCFEAGMNDLLGKPIMIRSLIKVLSRYMPEFADKA